MQTSFHQSASDGRDLLLGRDHDLCVARDQLEQVAEAVERKHVGDVGALVGLRVGGHLGQLAVLGRQLGGGLDLDVLGVLERALREGGEPRQPLDLDVEQLDADGAFLGRRIDVEDVAAHRELAALLDLVDALVAGGDELVERLVDVDHAALVEREAVRAQLRVGDLLAEGGGGDDDDRGVARTAGDTLHQRVEGADAEADEVRRRREARLVADAAARVEADGPRGQVGLQVGGQVARRAVVAGDDERGAAGLEVEQAREQIRAQAGRRERPLRFAQRGFGQAARRRARVVRMPVVV